LRSWVSWAVDANTQDLIDRCSPDRGSWISWPAQEGRTGNLQFAEVTIRPGFGPGVCACAAVEMFSAGAL